MTVSSPCGRCIEKEISCHFPTKPRRKACKQCSRDKKTCYVGDAIKSHSTVKRSAASGSTIKDLLTNVEGYTVMDALNTLSVMIDSRHESDTDLLHSALGLVKAQEQTVGLLGKMMAGLVDIKERLMIG